MTSPRPEEPQRPSLRGDPPGPSLRGDPPGPSLRGDPPGPSLRLGGYRTLKLIGRRGLFWIAVNASAGVLLANIEIAFSVLLALLLRSLGVTSELPDLPAFVLRFAESPNWVVVGLLVVGTLRGLALLAGSHSAVVATEVIALRLKLVAFHDELAVRSKFISAAEIHWKTGEMIPKAASFCFQAMSMIPHAIQAVLLLVVMLLHSLDQTLFGLGGVVVTAAIIHLVTRSVRHVAGRMPDVHGLLLKQITRVVRNWFLLRVMRTLPAEHDAIVRQLLTYTSVTTRAGFLAQVVAVVPQTLGVFVVAGLILVHAVRPQMTGLELVAFLYLYFRFVQSLSAVSGAFASASVYYSQFRYAMKLFFSFDPSVIYAALRPAKELSVFGWHRSACAQPLEIPGAAPTGASFTPPEIVVDRLWFRYAPELDWVLEDVSLRVRAGKQGAIVGPSGAGKSSLLGVVLGILEATQGRVEVGGEDPRGYFARHAGGLGYVGAEPFLIAGSVRENLLYGLTERRSDDEMRRALALARLDDWVSSLPEGLAYQVSENGEGLSSGQKQRLCLARALLPKPALLVLDEISANLDAKTEAEIAETIRSLEGSCTVLIVSHREALVSHVTTRLELSASGAAPAGVREPAPRSAERPAEPVAR